MKKKVEKIIEEEAEIESRIEDEERKLDELKEKKEELVEEEKKIEAKGSDRMLVWSIAFVVAFLILIFSAGYFLKSRESYETITYNHFEFTNIGGMWYFDWQDEGKLFSIPLRFNPYDVENVTIQGRLNESFNREDVYITFDPDSDDMTFLALGAAELSVNMARAIKVRPLAACTKDSTETEEFDFCKERPIVTCSEGKSVIYLKTSEKTRILLIGECIVLEGRGFELLRAIDRLLYQWYGIIG